MEITNETKILGGVIAATVLIIIGGAFMAGRGGTQDAAVSDGPVAEADRLARDDDAFQGPADAAVTVVEFGDFECPACGAVHPILKQLKADNADASVKFVYRQFPLNSIHPLAQKAAEASEAAGAQGKFWEYHDRLFENQHQLTRDDLIAHAQALELDVEQFTTELDDGTYRDAVTQDVSDGTAIGVRGTPAIYINGVQFTGGFSLDAFQAAIDTALSAVDQAPIVPAEEDADESEE